MSDSVVASPEGADELLKSKEKKPIKRASGAASLVFKWQILRVMPGRESLIMQQLKVNLTASNLMNFVKDINFPTTKDTQEIYSQEEIANKEAIKGVKLSGKTGVAVDPKKKADTKKGKKGKDGEPVKKGRAKTSRALYPGYIFFKIHNSDAITAMLRNIPGVYGFLLENHKPKTLTDDNYAKMLSDIQHHYTTADNVEEYNVGDKVQIKTGSFNGFSASVLEVDKARELLHLSISVFKRETKVTIPMPDAEKITD